MKKLKRIIKMRNELYIAAEIPLLLLCPILEEGRDKMQEEVEQKTVNLAVTTTKLTGRVAVKAIAWYLRHRKEKKLEKVNEIPHGKQSVKKLIGQNAGVSTIDVSKTGLRDFERIAKKYNVDFAVTKDKTVDPPKYVIFFKARDADALNQVVKEYSAKQLDKAKNSSRTVEVKKYKSCISENRQKSLHVNVLLHMELKVWNGRLFIAYLA